MTDTPSVATVQPMVSTFPPECTNVLIQQTPYPLVIGEYGYMQETIVDPSRGQDDHDEECGDDEECWCGAANSGETIEYHMPKTWHVWGGRLFAEYIHYRMFVVADELQTSGGPFMGVVPGSPNIHASGYPCYGENGQPLSHQEAWTVYWNSRFNNDLPVSRSGANVSFDTWLQWLHEEMEETSPADYVRTRHGDYALGENQALYVEETIANPDRAMWDNPEACGRRGIQTPPPDLSGVAGVAWAPYIPHPAALSTETALYWRAQDDAFKKKFFVAHERALKVETSLRAKGDKAHHSRNGTPEQQAAWLRAEKLEYYAGVLSRRRRDEAKERYAEHEPATVQLWAESVPVMAKKVQLMCGVSLERQWAEMGVGHGCIPATYNHPWKLFVSTKLKRLMLRIKNESNRQAGRLAPRYPITDSLRLGFERPCKEWVRKLFCDTLKPAYMSFEEANDIFEHQWAYAENGARLRKLYVNRIHLPGWSAHVTWHQSRSSVGWGKSHYMRGRTPKPLHPLLGVENLESVPHEPGLCVLAQSTIGRNRTGYESNDQIFGARKASAELYHVGGGIFRGLHELGADLSDATVPYFREEGDPSELGGRLATILLCKKIGPHYYTEIKGRIFRGEIKWRPGWKVGGYDSVARTSLFIFTWGEITPTQE